MIAGDQAASNAYSIAVAPLSSARSRRPVLRTAVMPVLPFRLPVKVETGR